MKELDQRLHHEFEVAQPSRGPVTDLVVGVVSELLSREPEAGFRS